MTKNDRPKGPVSKSLARRTAGRPSASDLQGDDLREHVISSASLVYGEHGYRGTSVALITKAAGISRPLFYRLFKNSREVIEIIVTRANAALFTGIMKASSQESELLAQVSSGIDAYFTWCQNYGVVVGPIYREMNDPESPACVQRNLVMEKLMDFVLGRVEGHGYPRLDSLLIDTLVLSIEHIGIATFWPKAQSEKVIKKNRIIVQRIVMATVALPEDQDAVPPLESVYY